MASSSKIRAGQAYVELALDDKISGQIAKSESNLKARVQSIAQLAKQLRLEDRKQGETALAGILRGGGGGVADALFSLMGAGATGIGIDFVGRMLKDAAVEAANLKKEFNEGAIGVGDIVERGAAAVPIFGQMWQAGRAIRELFTGEAAAAEQINREAKLTVDLFDAQARSAKALQQIRREMGNEQRRLDTQLANFDANPFQQERNNILAARKEREDNAPEERRKKIADAKKDAAEAIKAQHELVKMADQALENSTGFDKFTDSRGFADRINQINGLGLPDAQRKLALKLASDRMQELQDAQLARQTLARLEGNQGKIEVEVGGKFDAEQTTKGKIEDKQMEDVNRRERETAKKAQEDFGRVVADGVRTAADEISQAKAETLRQQGKDFEAENLLIESETRSRIVQILRAAEDQKKVLGASGFLDPRALAIDSMAQAQAGAAMQTMAVKKETVKIRGEDEEAGRVRDLAQLRAQAVQNIFDRERAEIDARYDYEFSAARDNAEKIAHLRAAKAIEISNLEKQHAEEQRRAVEDIDYQIDAQKIQNGSRGITHTLAMIELERRRALNEDADPAKAVHVGAERINELYDLKRDDAFNSGQIARGSFNAAAIRGMGVGGASVVDEAIMSMAKDAAKTAANTAEISDKIEDIGPVFGP